MTKEELDAQARMLAESQQKYITSVHMMIEGIQTFRSYVHSFQDSMESHRAVMESVGEGFQSMHAAFEASLKVFAEGFTAVSENTQKLDKMIARMEAYFGSGTGLEYDN